METLKTFSFSLMMILMQFASGSTTYFDVETTANKPASSPAVKLELYYESLCFGCQNFISGPLQDAWKSLQSSGKNNVRNSRK